MKTSLPPPEVRAQVSATLTQSTQSLVPQNKALGISVVDYGTEDIWMKLPYHADLVGNPMTGVLHGGAITTLMDAACGMSIFIAAGKPVRVATLDLRIDYMKPAPPGHDVIVHAHCYKITRHVCFVRGTAYTTVPADPVATVAATFARKRRKPSISETP